MPESEQFRTIDGKKYRVTRLPAGMGGRAISRDAFGGRTGRRGKDVKGAIGQRESITERLALRKV